MILKKKIADDKEHDKLPSRQRVNENDFIVPGDTTTGHEDSKIWIIDI